MSMWFIWRMEDVCVEGGADSRGQNWNHGDKLEECGRNLDGR